jgi:hypothetical protein
MRANCDFIYRIPDSLARFDDAKYAPSTWVTFRDDNSQQLGF